MANPLSLDAIAAECRRLGLDDVRFVPGARTADRPGRFTPHGVTVHITAGGLGSRTEEQYIRDIINGDPFVPLKANAVTAPDGTLWLNAQGNANHCLYYGAKAWYATLNASFPLSGNANYRGSLTKWSLYSYGNEMIAASGSRVTNAQRRSAVIYAAAIARLHGWTGQETHGHGEVAYDRSWSDPGIDMGEFRRDVMALVLGENISAGPSRPPLGDVTVPKDWFDMATLDDLKNAVSAELDKRLGDVVPAPWFEDDPDNESWVAGNVWSSTLSRVESNRQMTKEVLAAVRSGEGLARVLWEPVVEQDESGRVPDVVTSSWRNNVWTMQTRMARMEALINAMAEKALTEDEVRAASEEGARAALDAKISDAKTVLHVSE